MRLLTCTQRVGKTTNSNQKQLRPGGRCTEKLRFDSSQSSVTHTRLRLPVLVHEVPHRIEDRFGDGHRNGSERGSTSGEIPFMSVCQSLRSCCWLLCPSTSLALEPTRLYDEETGAAQQHSQLVAVLSKLDSGLEDALRGDHIRLLRSAWLRARPPGWKMLRRQELEAMEAQGEQPFLSSAEAVDALRAADRRIGVLS